MYTSIETLTGVTLRSLYCDCDIDAAKYAVSECLAERVAYCYHNLRYVVVRNTSNYIKIVRTSGNGNVVIEFNVVNK